MTVRKQAKLTVEGEAGGVDHLYESSSSRIALNEPGDPQPDPRLDQDERRGREEPCPALA